MRLCFEVGIRERHEVDFNYDNSWGRLRIKVDGTVIVQKTNPFWVPVLSTWNFDVGTDELHHVRLEKRRARFFPLLRPQTLSAYIDGDLVAQQDF